jgi:hypothetical protein
MIHGLLRDSNDTVGRNYISPCLRLECHGYCSVLLSLGDAAKRQDFSAHTIT